MISEPGSGWTGGGVNRPVSTQYLSSAQHRKVKLELLPLDLTCVSTAGCVV